MARSFGWPLVVLGDVLEFYGSGTTPRGGKDRYTDSGTPFVRSMNVHDLEFKSTGLAFMNEREAQSLNLEKIQARDVLINLTGASVARCCLAPDCVIGGRTNNHVMILRVNNNKCDARWLSYALSGPYKRKLLSIAGSGSTRETLVKSDIGRFSLSLPPVAYQRYTARILSSFDDLIENNRRRIEILEEMARLLYREWFVHFRFPGHEDIERVDSDLGPIPEGWEVSRVGNTLETVGGGTPSKETEEYWTEGNVQWFTPTDLTRAGAAFAFESGSKITELGLKKSSAKLFPPGSVMMTSRATIGVVSITTTAATTNQGFITTIPNECLPSSYIYFWLQSNVDLFMSLAGGATFKELRKSTFRELPILVPSGSEIEHFKERVGPMMALISNLLRQNQVLLEARDLLLQRLVSGELDVSELELELVEA